MSAGAPEAVLWDALRGALVTRALALAADLRLAHALSDGPRSVEELARDTGADADTLHRILRALASDGIFAETAPASLRTPPRPSCCARTAGTTSRISSGVSG